MIHKTRTNIRYICLIEVYEQLTLRPDYKFKMPGEISITNTAAVCSTLPLQHMSVDEDISGSVGETVNVYVM